MKKSLNLVSVGHTPSAAVVDDAPTHEIFEVRADAGRTKWVKVGEVNVDELERYVALVRLAGTVRELELVKIDRAERPVPAGKDARRYPTHELIDDGGFSDKKVGVAFMNRDGSHSLVIDDGSRDGPKTRLQMRAFRLRSRQA